MSAVRTAVLAATPPFDFACSLRAMKEFPSGQGDQVIHQGTVRKALPHPGDPLRAIVVEVGAPPDDACGVRLTVYADAPLTDDEAALVQLRVGRWLGLADDRSAFLAAARADPAMAGLLAVAEGLHQVHFPGLAEGATYFTMTQRSTPWSAGSRKRRLATDHGPRFSLDGLEYIAFPAFSTLLALTAVDMAAYAGGWARGKRLRDVLAGVNELDEEWLRTAPFTEARDALLAVSGIGPFTAHGLLLQVLGRPDDVPSEMAQFGRAAEKVYGDQTPTAADLRERYGATIGWWSYLARTALTWVPASGGGAEGSVEQQSVEDGERMAA